MKIKIYPRIALNLIAMHDGIYRKNGGIGFSIKNPSSVISFEKSKKFEIIDKRKNPFETAEMARLLQTLKGESKKNRFKHKIKIVIKGKLPTHSGFGSSTAIRLGCIEGLYLTNNYHYTQYDLIKASNRGGTSGIGINTYFEGGYVFDIGKKIDGIIHTPSSVESVLEYPLKIIHDDMPNWDIGICIPNIIKTKTEEEEKEFFKSICPIQKDEAYKMLYHTIYGVLASIKEENINIFSKAIRHIQNCSWKSSERSLYGNELLKIEEELYKNDALAVGMSSLGPMLFFTAKDINKVIKKSKKNLDCILIKSKINNHGRKVEY